MGQATHASQLDIERLEKTFGIAWILVKLHDATASDSVLESKIFFSTSEYAQVPRRATDLFLPLVQQLLQEWNLTLHAAENRLEMKRTELLMANGKNPRLIRDLLGDAQLWDLLRKSCKQQINDLVALQTSYYMSESWAMLRENKSTELNGLKEEGASFRKEIDGLEQEFNLTSIGEAQKSTSTNKSMKRLSWITSLFGMNIDVLANNPPWWLYIPFAVVTTFFTLAVWLIFKYNVDLEENIDLGFKRLLKAPALGKSLTKASTDDPSHGNEPQV
ncbi:ankyrin-2 [Penicillium manginii]|uniref:ankyrin-2 n=1 Tax=Penicillium manginii TaxID=203109 RepID=UPI00254693F1|nr:ankyrin-2 [Penicillium manginii]KAJ5768516.1 ankyrin-2 [Penicillium manginii]